MIDFTYSTCVADQAKVCSLLIAGEGTISFMAHHSATTSTNAVLKMKDSIFFLLSKNYLIGDKAILCDGPVMGVMGVFSHSIVTQMIELTSFVLHDA